MVNFFAFRGGALGTQFHFGGGTVSMCPPPRIATAVNTPGPFKCGAGDGWVVGVPWRGRVHHANAGPGAGFAKKCPGRPRHGWVPDDTRPSSDPWPWSVRSQRYTGTKIFVPVPVPVPSPEIPVPVPVPVPVCRKYRYRYQDLYRYRYRYRYQPTKICDFRQKL